MTVYRDASRFFQ